jgi:hypothetical protein
MSHNLGVFEISTLRRTDEPRRAEVTEGTWKTRNGELHNFTNHQTLLRSNEGDEMGRICRLHESDKKCMLS